MTGRSGQRGSATHGGHALLPLNDRLRCRANRGAMLSPWWRPSSVRVAGADDCGRTGDREMLVNARQQSLGTGPVSSPQRLRHRKLEAAMLVKPFIGAPKKRFELVGCYAFHDQARLAVRADQGAEKHHE
jgi:hypothetical protein